MQEGFRQNIFEISILKEYWNVGVMEYWINGLL